MDLGILVYSEDLLLAFFPDAFLLEHGRPPGEEKGRGLRVFFVLGRFLQLVRTDWSWILYLLTKTLFFPEHKKERGSNETPP